MLERYEGALGRKCRLIAVGFYDKSFKKCRRIANPKIILSQDRMKGNFLVPF